MSKTEIAYFEQEDILHLEISDEPETGSIELSPNITAELNDNGDLIGIEILNASTFVRDSIKEVFKQAFAELLQERRDLLYDVFTEVLEDIALANAIKEGEETQIVSREQVFEL